MAKPRKVNLIVDHHMIKEDIFRMEMKLRKLQLAVVATEARRSHRSEKGTSGGVLLNYDASIDVRVPRCFRSWTRRLQERITALIGLLLSGTSAVYTLTFSLCT